MKCSLGLVQYKMGFPGDSDGKESSCNVGDLGLIPVLGRSPREEIGYPLQYSCLESSIDRGAWQATAHGIARVGHDWATRERYWIKDPLYSSMTSFQLISSYPYILISCKDSISKEVYIHPNWWLELPCIFQGPSLTHNGNILLYEYAIICLFI